MKALCDKTFTLQPVAGPLDMTSSADAVPFGGYRYVENFETNPQDKKMRRMTGYQRFLPTEQYENPDLHYRYGLPRQHLTFGFEAKTPIGFTKLFAATQNTLFSKNNATQHWSVIWDGFGGEANLNGCSEVIMQAANVNSTVLFSNDFDEPVYHIIDQPANGDGTYVQAIPDFQTLKITRVGFLYAWNNLVIAANVVMDGVRQTNLILWSDYKKPISFVPNKDSSLAGRKFLAYGEIVLNAAELADALLLYTNRGVWEIRVSDAADAEGNPVVLSFTKRYTPDKAGSRCLKFKRTLVTTGDDHYYAGQDGIYKYNFYQARPEIEEWSRRAASYLFINSTISKSKCSTHCAGYDTTKKAYWFSYARQGEQCNSETLVMNTETHFSSVVKEGFSFFLNHNPRNLLSLRQWILANCLCSPGPLPTLDRCIVDTPPTCDTYELGPIVEVGDYDGESLIDITGLDPEKHYLWTPGVNENVFYNDVPSNPDHVEYTDTTLFKPLNGNVTISGNCSNCPYTGVLREVTLAPGFAYNYTNGFTLTIHGITSEDWQRDAAEGSLRTALAGVTVQDLCGAVFTNECSAGTLFIMAATADRCIKQLSDVLFREWCIGFEKCGTYENRGYLSIARSGPISLSSPSSDKTWTRFNVEAEPDVAVIPGRISLRIGVAATALDPNLVSCPIYWEALMDPATGQPFKLQCLSDKTEAQHEADGTRPDKRYEWPMFHAGKFHYFEITIHNQDSSPLDVGAGVTISRMEFDARLECQ